MKKERRYDTSQERIAEKTHNSIIISQNIFEKDYRVFRHFNFKFLNQKTGTVPDLTYWLKSELKIYIKKYPENSPSKYQKKWLCTVFEFENLLSIFH